MQGFPVPGITILVDAVQCHLLYVPNNHSSMSDSVLVQSNIVACKNSSHDTKSVNDLPSQDVGRIENEFRISWHEVNISDFFISLFLVI
jgi:hypothetical protein